MGIKDLKSSLTALPLAFAIVFSMILVVTPVYSGGCISHPHGTTITVAPGDNFLLRYKLYWNEPGWDGAFGVVLNWYNYDNKPEENLTFLSARAYWEDNLYNITCDDPLLTATPSGSNTLWALEVKNTSYYNLSDDNFYVDIWFRASGTGNVPHAPRDNHPFFTEGLKAVTVFESGIVDIAGTEKPITIRVLSVPVLISPSYQENLPGENLQYTVMITNTGTENDNYDLTVSDNENWDLSLSKNKLENIGPGENKTTTLTVTIPENAIVCTEDNITVTATGTRGENKGWCIAHAIRGVGAIVSISPSFQENWAGGTLDYTVTVKNIGITNDNYTLENTDDLGWTLRLDNDRFEDVPPDNIRTTILHVTIDNNATHCIRDNITVTAISEENENVRDNGSCIAHALTLWVEVSISPSENKRVPGEKLVYTVTVKNTGIKPDNYDLKVTDNAGWGLALDNNKLKNIENGKSENVTLTVTIPEGTGYGTRDKITVTATSQGDNTVEDSASCIAQSATVSLDIWIMEQYPTRVHGGTATFTVYVKNKSEDNFFRDNYLLTVKDNENWGPNFGPGKEFIVLPGILTGENGVATLYVTIPENAAYGTNDNVIVTATSAKDTYISKEASCIARSATVKLAVSITPGENIRIHGENANFTVEVKNTSDDPLFRDNYILTAKDNVIPGWKLKIENIENVLADNTKTSKLTVTIPGDAKYGTVDNVIVTAKSAENTYISENASCIARSATVSFELWIDPEYPENLPGENTTFLVWANNITDDPLFQDNYILENIWDNLGWQLWLQDNHIKEWESARLTVTIDNNATNCTEDIVTVAAKSQFDNAVSRNANCTAHALTFRVEVSISPSEIKRIQRGDAEFTVTVKNTGLKPDNYTLNVSENVLPSWNPTLDNENFYNVGPGENRQTTLRVTIPPSEDVSYGTRNKITVTATGTGVSDNASCIAHSATVLLEVSIPENEWEIHRMHGENAIFTVKVINWSEDLDFKDNYTLENKDNLGWQLWLENNYIENVGVGLANSRTTTLTVYIPENESYCTRDDITVTATSRENENVRASASCIAHSATVSLDIWIEPDYRACVPGENATFTVYVKNTSEDPLFQDNYTLENKDNLGWVLMLSKYRLENLKSGKSENLTLTVTIPENENALEGRRDNIIVTAKSDENENVRDNASCIARAGFVNLEVSISCQKENPRAFPGGELTYDVWVKNTGTVVENFEFVELIDDRGWISRTVSPKTFTDRSPGENGYATFIVKIPTDAAHGAKNNITVKWRAVHTYGSFKENVYPSGDAYVDNSEPSSSHNENLLCIKNDHGTPQIMSWLKFDLSLPSGAENMRVADAKLWLFVSSIFESGGKRKTGAYFSRNDDWSEDTITYINMPSLASTPTDSIDLVSEWDNWDVGDDAHLEFEGDKKASWCLKNEGGEENYEMFCTENSKEAPSNHPYLEVTYENASKVLATGTATAEATYIEIYLKIQKEVPKIENGRPGDNITFPVVIANANMENVADNYTLTVIDDAGWNPTLNNYSFKNVPWGESRDTELKVTIPENALSGTIDNLTVTATSQADNTVSTSDYCHVLVIPFRRKVGVSITPTSQRNLPGSTLNYTVIVKNEGDAADNYTLTVNDNAGWSPSVSPSTLSIAANNTKYATLTVVIPEGAENGTTDGITVTSTSKYDSGIRDSASCTAVASTVPPIYGVQVSIFPEEQSDLPGKMLTYTVTVKNTGEAEDTYDLSVSDTRGWGATLSDYLLTVPARENRTTTIATIVPSGAVKDESTVITVVATSRADPRVENSATCTAKATETPSEIPIPLIAGAAIGVGAVATVMLLLKRRV